ncbi:MAG: tripartite tricarboxylate transporter substrate-binding protein, partial [Bradyrhizobium sp.]
MTQHQFHPRSLAESLYDANSIPLTRRSLLGLAAGMAAFASAPALSQAYPSRPIRFVIPYAPGGGTDSMVRSMQGPLARILGQPVIVDNKSGAAGAIGVREVARAAPDGYT